MSRSILFEHLRLIDNGRIVQRIYPNLNNFRYFQYDKEKKMFTIMYPDGSNETICNDQDAFTIRNEKMFEHMITRLKERTDTFLFF